MFSAIKLRSSLLLFYFIPSFACAQDIEPIDGHQLQLCFFELRFEIENESQYEDFLDAKFSIDNQHYQGAIIVQPLADGETIFFADKCDTSLDYLSSGAKPLLEKSSHFQYSQALIKMIRETDSE